MVAYGNDGMDYGFSMIRTMMRLIGVWPLQQNFICTFRWILVFITESLTVMGLLIDYFKNCGDIKDNLEFFLMIDSCFHAWINVISARVYMKRIAVNVSSAMDDWSLSTEKQSYVIMMRYAKLGRIITILHLMIGVIAAPLYYVSTFTGSKQQVVTIGNDTTILWNFVIPASCLFKEISYSTYKAILVLQILQGLLVYTAECASDSFFFAITMHLCGQLELLRIRFVEIERQIADRNHYRNFLRPWIRRHNKLIILAKNIEDSFNLTLLIRLSIITIVIAVSGMRLIVSVKHQNYTDVVKSITFIQLSFVQSFMFTHAGDTLRNQSESIVLAIHDSTWHKFSPSAMKDLIFIMMRTNIPLQLTAGKFFYITRSTMTDILKTALTYISFLQVTMTE
ncbi:odorant receptor 85c-like [Anoplolepis gracilipes]|uniref:odorant receptor 85c-like n=1 Tax=Anoplolepis gracilipes TaxID=354296 RepID=UPI003BA07CE8